MNFLSNHKFFGPSRSTEWDWNGVDSDQLGERNSAAPGSKRTAEEPPSNDTGSSAKRIKFHKSTPSILGKAPSSMSTNLAKMRSPRLSSSRPSNPGFGNSVRSDTRTTSSKAPAPFQSKAPRPFIEQDDSDDEMDTSPTPMANGSMSSPSTSSFNNRSSCLSAAQEKHQRQESAPMRGEAKLKTESQPENHDIFTSSSTLGRSEKSSSPFFKPRQPTQTITKDMDTVTTNRDAFRKSPLPSSNPVLHRRSSARSASAALYRAVAGRENKHAPMASNGFAAGPTSIDLTLESDDEIQEVPKPSRPPFFHQHANQVQKQPSRVFKAPEHHQAQAFRDEQDRIADQKRESDLHKQTEDRKPQSDVVRGKQPENDIKPLEYGAIGRSNERESQLKLQPVGDLAHQKEQQRRLEDRQNQEELKRFTEERDRLRRERLRRQQDELLRKCNERREFERREFERREDERQNQEREIAENEFRESQEREMQKRRQADEQRRHDEVWAEFERGRARAEAIQAEQTRKADLQRQEEEKKLELERQKQRKEAAKPFTDRECEAMRMRDERIQKQQRRNAQRRELDSEDDLIIDEDPLPPSNQPISLTSLVRHAQHQRGETALPTPSVSGSRDRTANFSESQCLTSQAEKRSHQRKLGEITYDDAQLLKWMDWDLQWSEIVKNFETRLKIKRSETTLRKRYRALEAAFEQAEIPQTLRERLHNTEREPVNEALREINVRLEPLRQFESKKPQQQKQKAPVKQSNGLLNSIIKRSAPPNTFHGGFTRPTGARKDITLPPPPAPPRRPLQQTQIDTLPRCPPIQRPTTGGKTINWDIYNHVMGGAVDVWEIQEAQVKAAEQEGIGENDGLYFMYFVYRREWTLEDLELLQDGGTETEWMLCHGEYEDVREANVAASNEVLRAIPGSPVFIDDDAEYDLGSRNIGKGMKRFFIENEDVGSVETAVQRVLRTPEERILPRSKLHWKPTGVYILMQKVAKKIVDEVLDEVRHEVTESQVSKHVYYDLGQANHAAASFFAEKTYTSPIPRLEVRNFQKAQMRDCLLESLDEEQFFHMDSGEGGDEDGDGDGDDDGGVGSNKDRIVVWVEHFEALGPRN